MKKIFTIIIDTILLCVAIFCIFNVYNKVVEYKKADNVYETISESVNDNTNKTDTTNKVEDNKPNSVLSKYNKLIADNEDYRCWLKMDNTKIDYPVVQSNDNSYYLDRDFNKNHLAAGSIFMDFRNNFDSDKSVVIYGHNMRNGTMFGELDNFKKESFFNENNKFKIEYKDKTYTYEVFSVYIGDASENFVEVEFDSDEDYIDYLNRIKSKSLFKSDIEVSNNDKIVTLYTCSYEFDGARTVVNGKLISVE